jgi:3-isopropylmalate dehydrogenase
MDRKLSGEARSIGKDERMSIKIIVLPGDGIGQEVTEAALLVMENRCKHHGLLVEVQMFPAGGKAIEEFGDPLPEHILQACLDAGIVFFGAVGDSRFDSEPPERRPEAALFRLRKKLGLFANLRPITYIPLLEAASPLKAEIIRDVDILIVRELTGGIYFGEPRGREFRKGREVAFNSEVYWDFEIERIARVAFESSRKRRRLVTSVDKSNVMESSQLWRDVVSRVALDYPDVELNHILVDNCAMQLIGNPRQFDVLLCNNIFGDILSDEGAMLTGSIGMLPSASLGELREGIQVGMYEPVHGSAPDIAGEGKANPLASIYSLALLFRHSLGRDDIALEIETAVDSTLKSGHRTVDLASEKDEAISTNAMVRQVLANLPQ